MSRGICRTCEAPVHFAAHLKQPQWVHDRPLGEMRVSEAEAAGIKADAATYKYPPKRKDRPFDRIHQPEPNREVGVF